MSHRFAIAATLLAFALAAPACARDMPAGRDGAIVVAQASTPALGEDTGKRKSRKREGAAKRADGQPDGVNCNLRSNAGCRPRPAPMIVSSKGFWS